MRILDRRGFACPFLRWFWRVLRVCASFFEGVLAGFGGLRWPFLFVVWRFAYRYFP